MGFQNYFHTIYLTITIAYFLTILLINSKTKVMNFCTRTFLRFVVSLCLLLIGITTALAQNGQFDVRFTVKNFDCANNKVTIAVQVKAHDAAHTFLMGDANYRFDYDPRVIKNPAIVSQENFSNQAPSSDLNYIAQNLNGSSVGPTLGTVSLNSIYGGGGLGAKLVVANWMTVSCIRFDVQDATKCMELIWHDDTRFPITGMNEVVLTSPTPDGNYDQYIVASGGVFQNYSICIPTVCSGITAIDDINATKANTPVSGTAATNDASNGGAMTFTAIGTGTNGTWSLQPNGSYSFTPTTGFIGEAVQKYQVCNAAGLCDTANIFIAVTEIPTSGSQNLAPVALNDNAQTTVNVPVSGDVLTNDFDPDGNTLIVNTTPLTNPTNGSVVINPNGTYTYTPNNGFVGQDTIKYQVCDNGTPSKCDTAQVIVTIGIDNNGTSNDKPNAQDDASSGFKGSPITDTLSPNDSDPNGNTLTYNTTPPAGGNPTKGTVSINPNGTFTYTPTDPNYTGPDQFKYVVCDNGTPSLCDTATVDIMVYPRPNDPPVITETPKTTPEDSIKTICVTYTDPNAGDTHTPTLCGTKVGTVTTPIAVNGQLCFSYTPASNYNGQDTVCIILCDQYGACDTAKIPITVTPVPDPPVIVDVIPPTIPEDSTITVCSTITDPDTPSGPFTVSSCGTPAGGTTTPSVNGNQLCITYTPTPNFAGLDTICVIVCDQSGLCDTILHPITVTPKPDAPVVTETPKTTPEDTPVTICQTITDPDAGSTFTATPCGVLHGTLGTPVVNGNQVCVTYLPASNYNGPDTVCLIICDNSGLCDTAKVPVTVTPVNDAPVVTEDPKTTPEDTPVTICQTITDPDAGNTFTATPCGVLHGTLGTPVVNGNQVCVTYLPASNYNGPDTVCLIICDNTGLCDTAKVPLTVTPVNDAPVVTETPKTTPEDTPVTICETITDPDAGDTFTASLCSTPAHGTASTPVVNGGQVCVTYLPTANYNGTDTVCIIVCDQTGKCDTAKIPVTVTPVADPPVVVDPLPPTTPEDSTITVCTTITDPDTPNGPFTVSNCSTPAGGTVTPSVTGNQLCITYTPAPNFNGKDTVCLTICDATGLCDTLEHIITVTPKNDPPVVRDSTVTAIPGTPITTCLPITDPDLADTHAAFSCGNPAHGTMNAQVVNKMLCVTYTPSSSYVGKDSVCLIVCDNGNPTLCDTVKIVYSVETTNLPPVATNDINSTLQGTTSTGNVLTNDMDPNTGQTLTTTVLTNPAHAATFTLNPNGTYSYTPTAGYVGTDSIRYIVCDNGAPVMCDTALLVIEIRPITPTGNQRPEAHDDNTSTPSGQPITVNVKSNDTDPNPGDTLSKPTLVAQPACGTATVNANGTITYVPTTGFIGTCNIEYYVCDNGTPSLCDTATLSVNVYQNPLVNNQAPNALDDATATTINTPVTGTAATNDNDPDAGQTLTYVGLTTPTNGSVVVQPNGVYTYTPTTGFVGKDSFRYKVCDNGTPVLCDTATVYINVTNPIVVPTNIAPVANPDNPVTTAGVNITIPVKTNDFDPNGDPLSNPTIISPPTCGTATVNADGTISFVPNTGFTGKCSFIYRVCDTGTPSLCDTALVTVTVNPTPTPANRPPVAINDAFIGNFNQPISSASVAVNDSDPDAGQTLTFTQLSLPNNGLVSFNGATGTFTYLPLANFIGRDSFRYKVCDNGTPSMCDTAWAFVTYQNAPVVNVAPIAIDDATETTAGTTVNIPVLSNDKDPNGTTLTSPTIVTQPTCGTASVNANGTIAFVPTTGFVGTCTFTYKVCDTGSPSLCDTATVTVKVNPIIVANQPPIAQNDATTTPMNTPVNGSVAGNDSDPDAGQTLTFTKVSNPPNGIVTMLPNGTFVYTPTTGFVGRDSFPYRACDNGSPVMCTTAWAYVDVTSPAVNINTPPVATDDKTTVTSGVLVNIPVKSNDYDLNPNQTLGNPTIISAPSCGTASVNANGTIAFQSTSGFVGVCTMTYSVCDNGAPVLCDTATVTLTVANPPTNNNTNLAPIAVDDANSNYKNVTQTGNVGDNDTDPNPTQTLTFTVVASPTHGAVTVNPDGSYSYVPTANYVGTDNFTYRVCDNGSPSLCDTATVYLTIFETPCVTFNLKVLMEGPYKTSTGKMTTILNQRGLLPGQTPIGQFAVATAAGQPYKGAPWNYTGTEGDTIHSYPSTVVDWVLVSFRSSVSTLAPVWRCAGWLHEDGSITFPKGCIQLPSGSYFILIEHRNHMGVMSPVAVPVLNNVVTFDFTTGDSYIVTNPPSFGAKALSNGKWVMYGADGMKTSSITNFDINFNDSQLWKLESGIFDQYRRGDFNLDADVNFSDQVLWKANNGRYSGVPH